MSTPSSDPTPPPLKEDFNPRVKELVGAKGLLPVFLAGRFYEAQVTILAVEPSAGPQFDRRHAIDYSQFTVRYEEGMLIEGQNTGVYWGSRFSKLGGV